MAQWINYDSVLAQITGYGIIVKGGLDVGTPRPVKCFVEGEREKRGWYRLYELTTKTGDTLIVGSYGIWRGNDPGTQKVRIDKEALGGLDADQLAAMKARVAEDRKRAEAERHREAEAAAAKAGAWWRQCQDAGESAYLARKGLGGKLYGARISKSGNLVIPIQDGDGKTWGLQVIYSDPAIKARKGRDKDYTPPGLDKRASGIRSAARWAAALSFYAKASPRARASTKPPASRWPWPSMPEACCPSPRPCAGATRPAGFWSAPTTTTSPRPTPAWWPPRPLPWRWMAAGSPPSFRASGPPTRPARAPPISTTSTCTPMAGFPPCGPRSRARSALLGGMRRAPRAGCPRPGGRGTAKMASGPRPSPRSRSTPWWSASSMSMTTPARWCSIPGHGPCASSPRSSRCSPQIGRASCRERV